MAAGMLPSEHRRLSARHAECWCADVSDDRSYRDHWLQFVSTRPQEYDAEETAAIRKGEALLQAFDSWKATARDVPGISPTVDKAQTKFDKRTGRLIGRAEGIIRGVAPLEVCAYMMNFGSKHQKATVFNPLLHVIWEVREVKNEHHTVIFVEMRMKGLLKNRTFLNVLVWRQVSDSPPTFVWVSSPIRTHPSVSVKDEEHAVRGEGLRCFRLTQLGPNTTKAEWGCALDLRGRVPKFVNAFAIRKQMAFLHVVQKYFMQIKPADSLVAADGTSLGHMLMDVALSVPRRQLRSTVDAFVAETAVLRECELGHLSDMLLALCENRLQIAKPVANADISSLSEAEALEVGRGFALTLLGCSAPAEAVADYVCEYPVLEALMQRYAWFRPMLNTVATRLLERSPYGLRLRLGIGAFLSICEVIIDLKVISSFFIDGLWARAYAQIGLIAGALLFGLVLCISRRGAGLRVVAFEIVLTLIFLKPPLDAYRVAQGLKQHVGAALDPMTELVLGKMVSMVVKSIPSAVLVAAVLVSGLWTKSALASLLMSCIAAAYTTTSIAFDLDLSSERRRSKPEFFGYVPDTSRLRVFALLFGMHLAHILGKTVAFAVLIYLDWKWLVAYMATDAAAVLLFKVVARDFFWHAPGSGVFVSLASRVCVTLFVSLTGCVHFRHPCELGGFCWSFAIVVNHALYFAVAALYSGRHTLVSLDGVTNGLGVASDDGGARVQIEGWMLFAFFGAMTFVSALCYCAFFLTIKRKYLRTFISFQTGRDFCQRTFLDNETDNARRSEIFLYNERQWAELRHQVRQWVEQNIDHWKEAEPAWFNEILPRIPDEVMPVHHLLVHHAQEVAQRKSSLAQISLFDRASIRY
jgi:hypothetical protein